MLRALLLQPRAHRVADRDDSIRPLEIEADRTAKRADERAIVEPSELDRHLGEDILADHD